MTPTRKRGRPLVNPPDGTYNVHLQGFIEYFTCGATQSRVDENLKGGRWKHPTLHWKFIFELLTDDYQSTGKFFMTRANIYSEADDSWDQQFRLKFNLDSPKEMLGRIGQMPQERGNFRKPTWHLTKFKPLDVSSDHLSPTFSISEEESESFDLSIIPSVFLRGKLEEELEKIHTHFNTQESKQ
jgi:hypothetical protein